MTSPAFFTRSGGDLLPPGGAVVFDMDGTILDTEAVIKSVWQRASNHFGYDLSDDLSLAMVGHRNETCLQMLQGAFGPGFAVDDFWHCCETLFERHVETEGIPLKPGARELVAYLHQRGLPMGVATSTDRDKACAHLESVGLLRYFSVLVGGNEVERPKPAPDIYIEAARRLGVLPALSLAVEDSPVGVRSAHAAGFSVIMVPDLLSPSKEIEALTIGILPSLHAMLLQLEPVTDGRRREMGG